MIEPCKAPRIKVLCVPWFQDCPTNICLWDMNAFHLLGNCLTVLQSPRPPIPIPSLPERHAYLISPYYLWNFYAYVNSPRTRLMSFWLLVQPEEPSKGRRKLYLSSPTGVKQPLIWWYFQEIESMKTMYCQLAKITLQTTHQKSGLFRKEKERNHHSSVRMHSSSRAPNLPPTCKKEKKKCSFPRWPLYKKIPPQEVTTKFQQEARTRELTRGPSSAHSPPSSMVSHLKKPVHCNELMC